MVAGLPRIEVKFLIDANGILHVSAREQRSGQQAEVEVKPTYGLTDEQVETMILDSFDHAEDDITARQLIEARNEANTILEAVAKGQSSPAWNLLTPEEHTSIAATTAALKSALPSTDYKQIRNAIEALDKATRRFAEIMMDSAVTGALGGKTMSAASEGIDAGLNAPTSSPHAFAKADVDDGTAPNLIQIDEAKPETPGESTED